MPRLLIAARGRPHGRAEHSLTIEKPVSDRDLQWTLDTALGEHGLTKPCVSRTCGEEIPTMPPFDMPAVVFRHESCPDMGQRRHDYVLGGISLTPLAWPQLIAWIGDEAPEIPNPRQMPPGMIATAQAEMLLPTLEEGGNTLILSMANQAWLRVHLEIYGIDRIRRVLGTLFSDADNLNLALVEAGLAEVYRGSTITDPYQPQYAAAEAIAQRTGRGMWALGAHYESPRAYRRRMGLRPSYREG